MPFKLTRAQERVWREIAHDLKRASPMQRLLQGDVGSGKTIVAALAALQAIESGKQVAFMAPTEILAEQHYRKLALWLDGLGVKIAWLSGSLPAKERRNAIAALASGDAQFAIGTHALFQEGVEVPKLGLAIIDEQHRFGVAQRLALRGKGLAEAHQLMMSATPIPRTLAMTFYADLDVSVLDEMPPGRTPVATRLVNQKRRRRNRRVGRQGVRRRAAGLLGVPADRGVGEARTADGGRAACRADGGAAAIRKVGLLHGRMKPADKAATMDAFVKGEIDVLVATTVIEVGVDVPNASIMVIEHAERFGLSQLHQLRGRVGRGAAESTCVLLFEEPVGDVAKLRLKVIFENTDGFEIARAGPADPRTGRIPGRPAIGRAAAALRRPDARRRADRAGARRGRRTAGEGAGRRAGAPRALAGREGAVHQGVTEDSGRRPVEVSCRQIKVLG